MKMIDSFYQILAKNKYNPLYLAIILMLLHFLSGYPGGMTPDSFSQFHQSLTFNFTTQHPPLMGMLWSVCNYIYKGPQLMLFFHLCLLWSGILFLYHSDNTNKYRYLYFIIPFVPNILAQSTIIWKDVGFGNSFFFASSVCIYYLYQKKKAPFLVSIALMLVAFYGLAVKFQAKFIIIFLVFFIVVISTNRGWIFRSFCAIMISLVTIFLSSTIIDKFAVESNYIQFREFFDIAAIIKDIDDDSLLPEYVKEYEGYNFATLKKNFTHKWIDSITLPEDRVYVMTQDPVKLKQLDDVFYKLIILHPLSYLKHRILNFSLLMNSRHIYYQYGIIDNEEALRKLDVHIFNNNFLKKFVIYRFLKFYPEILSANFISLALIILYSMTIKLSRLSLVENQILAYIILISLAFSVTIFIISLASDYRYYYIVRLLTFFTIPIYLKLRLMNKNI